MVLSEDLKQHWMQLGAFLPRSLSWYSTIGYLVFAWILTEAVFIYNRSCYWPWTFQGFKLLETSGWVGAKPCAAALQCHKLSIKKLLPVLCPLWLSSKVAPRCVHSQQLGDGGEWWEAEWRNSCVRLSFDQTALSALFLGRKLVLCFSALIWNFTLSAMFRLRLGHC